MSHEDRKADDELLALSRKALAVVGGPMQYDAADMARAHPEATIALIERHRAEVERLTRERDEAREMHKTMCDLALYRASEIEAAESALAAEQKRVEKARAILDLWFAPWGAAKAARWEDLSGGMAFSETVALDLLRAALAGKELGNDKG